MGSVDDSANMTYTDDEDSIEFTVLKYGDLSYSTEFCENAGAEFNPLEDPHNPTSSSATSVRGGLDAVTVSLDTNDLQSWTQTSFLQNLGGKDSIIGRSIKIVHNDNGTRINEGCCVIGLDAPPAPTTPAYTPHYHPAQHYGYGGYGSHGHHRGY